METNPGSSAGAQLVGGAVASGPGLPAPETPNPGLHAANFEQDIYLDVQTNALLHGYFILRMTFVHATSLAKCPDTGMRVLGLDFRYQLAIIALFHYILDMVEDQAKLCELNSVGNPMPGHLGDDVDNGYCQSHEPGGVDDI
ncbi:hypothetical protein CCMSSC00406_0007314 [Pleurotus cornucopiae]|uniref:Uncharacterized protein n=1 Tax=Pleurotus cornucopiae TaxID=5321 RepID=A0ACB7IJQ2_PLECO|nr:hypothetical protein CCMSSC00406_0007314 [Pleurotus cornucopiae]